MKYNRDILADNISSLMKDNNITQTSLSNIIGMHQSRMSDCLSKRKDFTLQQCIDIADYFNVSLDKLIGNETSTEFSIDSLADICKILFNLSDILEMHIGTEYIPAYTTSEAEMMTCSDNIDAFESASDNPIEMPPSEGDFCIVFESKAIQSFLSEWKDTNSFSQLSQPEILYNTWKTGILSIYKHNLKEHNFLSTKEYVHNLIEKKYDFCKRNWNISDDNEFKEASKTFDARLSESDLELIKQYENIMGDIRKLPFLPDVYLKS